MSQPTIEQSHSVRSQMDRGESGILSPKLEGILETPQAFIDLFSLIALQVESEIFNGS